MGGAGAVAQDVGDGLGEIKLKTSGLTDAQIKAADASAKLTQSLSDQVGLNELLLGGLNKESEGYRMLTAELEAMRSLGHDLNEQQKALIATRESQVTELRYPDHEQGAAKADRSAGPLAGRADQGKRSLSTYMYRRSS